ncbi:MULTISPECIES: DoxX family protein [unclassified Schlesneria]|uniref:DoxX family protein n=1 Tax=Schlesneria TaxID=656899 RepID=UPI002F07EC6B
MPSKAQRITGWILTGLVGLFVIGASGVPKFIDFPGKNEMMDKLGIPLPLLPAIGTLEIAVTLIYLIPRTSFLGAILLTGYLGGAVFTHVRVGDAWFFPVIIGVLAWLGLALRQPLIFGLVQHATCVSCTTPRDGESPPTT